MTVPKLDRINRDILIFLQKDTRAPIATIADSVGISTSACQKRIRQLEREQVIHNYAANLDLGRIAPTVTFFCEIALQEHNAYSFRKFEDAIRRETTLVECYQVSGGCDYFARFVCTDVEDFKVITDRLLANSAIGSIKSHCVLSKIKRFTGYPLGYLLADDPDEAS